MSKTGILIIDVQNDFLPGGAVEVAEGNKVINPILNLLQTLPSAPLFCSQDYHPEQTVHFKEGGGIWDPHCVVGTEGVKIQKDIFNAIFDRLAEGNKVLPFIKGTDPQDDAGYSAFEATDFSQSKSFKDCLDELKVSHLIVCGLATDYCVKASVLDALKNGYEVSVLADGVAAVNLQEGDEEKAILEMEAAGATFIDLEDLEHNNE